jgi:hypothetical protein
MRNRIASTLTKLLVLSLLLGLPSAAHAAGDAVEVPLGMCQMIVPATTAENPVERDPVKLVTVPCEPEPELESVITTAAAFAARLRDIEARLERNEAQLLGIGDPQLQVMVPPEVAVSLSGPLVKIEVAPVTVTVTESGEPTVVIIPAE